MFQRGGEVEGKKNGYGDYIRREHVLLGEGGQRRVPVKILRDSGTRHNLIARSVVAIGG